MAYKLIYDTGVFHIFKWICKGILFVSRYKIVGSLPEFRKAVVIGAPHTSNWDFPIFITLAFHYRIAVRFLGKDTLFKGPLGWLMYRLGGIPVDNKAGKDVGGVVAKAIQLLKEREDMVIGVAPEGTRAKVTKWKTGFYRIAMEANVPILLAYLDASKRELGFGELFYPTGDMEGDIKTIQAFYADKQGIKPQNKGF